MDDAKARARGLIIKAARERPSQDLVDDQGLPYLERVAKRMGVSKTTLSRLFDGKKRYDAVNPRDHNGVSESVQRGLEKWLSINREDVWHLIRITDPVKPIKFPRGPRPKVKLH